MTVFFTSDTHFGDQRVLRFDHRPFATIEDHDAALIGRRNAVVGALDTIWHLGDFSLGPTATRVADIVASLNGTKHLVVGNNDDAATLSAPGWASIGPYAEVCVEGRWLVLCHYAFRTWNGMGRGALNLHGHSHGKLGPLAKQYDVGVDAQNFQPVSLADILRSRRLSAQAKSKSSNSNRVKAAGGSDA